MKVAFIIFNGMTSLDFFGVYDAVTRLKTMDFIPDLVWDVCAFTPDIKDGSGLEMKPTLTSNSLESYDLVIVPGGFSTLELVKDTAFINWLKTAAPSPLKASVCTGSLLLGAAGFLAGKRATTHPQAYEALRSYCNLVSSERIVDNEDIITAGGVTSSIDLGLYLCEKLAGTEVKEKIRQQMDYQRSTSSATTSSPRAARIERHTKETNIILSINLDGSGKHQISTGLGFLDHMLTHIAVHGLFDLTVKATGDLHVDEHHTVEDVALVLGQALAEALGDKKGIVRTAHAYVPMDEALAFVALDLSGRPYSVLQIEWRTPAVGGIAVSLFEHFFESFAAAARINLHARVPYGRDDHHKAEALFKALARVLDRATQIDPRKTGIIPSTKGSL